MDWKRYFASPIIGIARGAKEAMPTPIACRFVFWERFPKQNIVASLNSKYLPPKKFRSGYITVLNREVAAMQWRF